MKFYFILIIYNISLGHTNQLFSLKDNQISLYEQQCLQDNLTLKQIKNDNKIIHLFSTSLISVNRRIMTYQNNMELVFIKAGKNKLKSIFISRETNFIWNARFGTVIDPYPAKRQQDDFLLIFYMFEELINDLLEEYVTFFDEGRQHQNRRYQQQDFQLLDYDFVDSQETATNEN